MYRVKSIEQNGHFRSGRHWGNEWVDVDNSEVTQQMRDDPRLRVDSIGAHESPIEYADVFTPFEEVELASIEDNLDSEVDPEPVQMADVKPPLYVSDKPSRDRPAKRR